MDTQDILGLTVLFLMFIACCGWVFNHIKSSDEKN